MKNFGAQNMVGYLKRVLMKKPLQNMSKVNLSIWNYAYPLNQELIDKNYSEFYDIIKKFGTEIIELKIEDNKEELCDSVFTHDPSLVINEGAIILNMGKKLRKKEAKEHEKLYNSINIPIIGKIYEKATVEGGDCLWINNKTLLVGESFRTNKAGIEQLTKILNAVGINLIPIKLPQYKKSNSCFHLMSLVSILDHDLVIGCLTLLPEDLIETFKQHNIKLIGIPEDEYFKSKTLSVNILALSPRELIMMQGFPKTEKLLIKEGAKINIFNGSELCIKAEGGPTCLTRPLWRED